MQPLRSQYQDDPDMRDLVCEFAAGLPARAAEAERMHSEGNSAELARIAHQLKGAGGGYGFPLITERAAALESSLRQGADDACVKERLALLVEVLRAVEVPEAS